MFDFDRKQIKNKKDIDIKIKDIKKLFLIIKKIFLYNLHKHIIYSFSDVVSIHTTAVITNGDITIWGIYS